LSPSWFREWTEAEETHDHRRFVRVIVMDHEPRLLRLAGEEDDEEENNADGQ
jgi:hypothetical protein